MASFLITEVRIFDGEAVIKNGTVLVEAGKIVKVSKTAIQYEGTTISRPGHTLLPGFIDAHVHIDFGNESGLAQGLRFGVTTQCDLGNAPFQIQQLRDIVKHGDCSDLKAAMQSATPDGGWPAPLLEKQGIKLPPDENPLKTSEQGRKFVQDQLQSGADFVKILHESGRSFGMELPTLSADVERGIIDQAHSSGLVVLAHAFSTKDAVEVLSLGVDGMAHVTVDEPPTIKLIEAYKKNNAFCCPTLSVIGSSTTEAKEMQERFAHDPRAQGLLVEGACENMCQCIAMTDKAEGSLANAIDTVVKLKESGIDIICGTDSTGLAPGTAYGLSLHQELKTFVDQCGFSPIEALRSATSLAAQRLKLPDRGWIREGMRADLVLLEDDPTSDIDATLNLRGVWIAGDLCSHYKNQF